MYRTGDLARYLADGSIDYLGRIDNQVKIRGFRIELGEIESALTRLPAVGKRWCWHARTPRATSAWWRTWWRRTDAGWTRRSLRHALQQRLPEYMVPHRTSCCSRPCPLTPNGKVDRKALPVPATTRGEQGYVAPRTATEDILAGIWADATAAGHKSASTTISSSWAGIRCWP